MKIEEFNMLKTMITLLSNAELLELQCFLSDLLSERYQEGKF